MKTFERLPVDSLIRNCTKIDYFDNFEYELESEKTLSADDIQVKFWTVMPKWLDSLFKLRNLLVKPFGLVTNGSMDELAKGIINGQGYQMCSVEKTKNETVLCLKDKHLITYISVYVQEEGNKKKVIVSTLVDFQNSLGFIYFYCILPFHKIIVKKMLKSSVDRVLVESK